jgi:hypothetical protein
MRWVAALQLVERQAKGKAQMPRACTICSHPERPAIDRALVSAISAPKIAAKYRVSEDAVTRHRAHIPGKLAQAQAAADVAQADDLLGQVQDLQRRTLAILATAEESDKLGMALGAIREARGNLELLAKLEGKLRDQQTVNILIAPQWLELRAIILGTLAPYPDVRAVLAQALQQAEHERH